MPAGSINRFRAQQREFQSQRRSGKRILAVTGFLLGAVLLLIILANTMFVYLPLLLQTVVTRLVSDPSPCVIKGEITIAKDRVYHLPGSRDYDRVTISTRRGERWFCTEQDARDAGWRPSEP